MRLIGHRRKYRARLFWWCTPQDLGAGAVLAVLFWLFVYLLPLAGAHNPADDLRARLRDGLFTAADQ